MTNIITKKNFPLLFLITMSILWVFYYSTNSWINGYGTDKQESWLLIDCFVTIPLVCFYCFWSDIKTALLKSVIYISLIILLGSFIIPQDQKQVWLHLESLRYIILFTFIIFEIVTIFTVVVAIKSSLALDKDPDNAIKEPIAKYFGTSVFTTLLQFEARVWTYAFFAKKVRVKNFEGIKHFNCHQKDGTQSNLLGFIIIILAEIPIVHILLHFIWSPYAANIISVLTVISLMWFIAEYRAIAIRPVSITKKGIIIRYSLFNPLSINFDAIKEIAINTESVSKHKQHKRYNTFGVPNIIIRLNKSDAKTYDKIFIGLDEPHLFLDTYEKIK